MLAVQNATGGVMLAIKIAQGVVMAFRYDR